jgi:PAS domain S-box-containing protein
MPNPKRVGVDDDLVCEHALALARPGRAVIGVDNDGMIICWDEEATRLYGWSEAEVLGRSLRSLIISHNDDDEAERILLQLRSGQSWSGNFLLKRRSGAPFIAHVEDTPVISDDGTLVGFVGVSWPAEG